MEKRKRCNEGVAIPVMSAASPTPLLSSVIPRMIPSSSSTIPSVSSLTSSTVPSTSSVIPAMIPSTSSTIPLISSVEQYPDRHIDTAILVDIIDRAFRIRSNEPGRIFPTKREIGYELFINRFVPSVLIDVFLAVIEQFPVIAAANPKYNSWWTPHCSHLVILIAEAFISALFRPRSTEKGECISDSDLDGSLENVRSNITNEQRCRIVRAVVLLNFNFECNFWNMAGVVLNFNKCPKDIVTIILDAARIGQASFTAVNYCISNKVLSRYINDPEILYIATLLGPLRASSVEAFAAMRSEEFRQKCRNSLKLAERLVDSPEEWERQIVAYFGSIRQNDVNGRVVASTHVAFRKSVLSLMSDLKGLPPSDDRISIIRAHRVLKRYATKYYHQKTCKIEHLHEVIWTILAQRPSMRKFVVKLLGEQFGDPQTAEIWQTCRIPRNARSIITQRSEEEHLDPRAPNPPYLSLPESVEGVEFVRHLGHLKRVENFLEDYANDSFPPVGVDAEWSPYVSYSKATILQLATPTHVFIIDIDGIRTDILAKFFQKLFDEWKLLKIGYRFDEDLVQLRNAIKKCRAFYYPKNLICIGALVETLMRKSAQRPEVKLDGVFHTEQRESCREPVEIISMEVSESAASTDVTSVNDNLQNITLQAVDKSDVTTKTIGGVGAERKMKKEHIHAQENRTRHNLNDNLSLFEEIKGLSALCERVLGKPLDKTEQCSVWDRRPLRDLQLRYAALDAYSMLMLYEKCVDWASRLDLTINEICSEQQPITEIPLFLDEH